MTFAIENAEISCDLFVEDVEKSYLETCADKIQSICQTVWNWTTTPLIGLWHITRSAIGSQIRNLFLFPLKPYLNHEQMKIETQYFADYWNIGAPTDPNLQDHQKVRDSFDMRDEIIKVVSEGKEYAVKCRIMESKGVASSKMYNFVFIPGNLTTLDNNVVGIHPFLSSYAAMRNDTSSLPCGRFFMTTQYDIQTVGSDGALEEYQPHSLDQAALILKEILAAFQTKYGEIDQLLAHSLGCILLSSALKYFESDIIPKNIAFHCGPSSLAEASKKFWMGRIIHKLAAVTGWSVDVAREIFAFRKKFNTEKAFSLVISGMKQDHYFSGEANLCSCPTMQELQQEALADLVLYDPPLQFFHDQAHHNLPLNFLAPNYVVSSSDRTFQEGQDHFAAAIIRRSLPTENPFIPGATQDLADGRE